MKMYWSRHPGECIDECTAEVIETGFKGTVREWYETLIQTIINVAESTDEPEVDVYVSPIVVTMIYCSVLFRNLEGDNPVGKIFGTEKPIRIFVNRESLSNNVLICKKDTQEEVGSVEVLGIPDL